MATEEDVGQTLFMFADPDPPAKKKWWRRTLDYVKEKTSCQKDDPELRRKALVARNGNYRVHSTGLSEHKRRYLADIYITLIDLPWRYAVAILFNAFLFTFLFFAILWWLVGETNGDFANYGNPNHTACLMGIQGFAGSILFSIETQTTIGYGFAYPNADCAGTLPLVYLQVVIGFLLETLMLGFIFVKVARPKYRAQTLLFSKHAVVCLENGEPCLQVRVGDLRKSHLLDATITAMVIILMWPVILTHRITEDSPLYDMRPADLSADKFEIVLFLTGTVEATGEVCQARTSYVPREILWGHRFERIEEYDISHGRWHVDFTSFDDVVYCQNLRHSARELAKFKATKSEGAEGGEGAIGQGEDVKGATGGKVKAIARDVKDNDYYKRALRLFRRDSK
ncbi:hypothetical protein BaRGS_00033728 [Batillaria attramentaria]|uniref:Uncharacterized protein n=1 Tax=Batillaria attramentaria TaxID=370345 RepID=A0ABD0JJB7_9CAEN